MAAIDFGTTYSGYAFSFKSDFEKDPTNVQGKNWQAKSSGSLKAPTCILLKPDQSFEAFGYEAEDRYAELAQDEEHYDYYYFRRFKMELYRPEVSLRKQCVVLKYE